MIWVNFLHFYQPECQVERTLRVITGESYVKIISILKRYPRARSTINFAPTLLELWEKYGYQSLLNDIYRLVARGQIEVVATARYHAFLPLLPKPEVERQIHLGLRVTRKFFSPNAKIAGFFSPEMGYSRVVAEAVHKAGFQWMILDEVAYNGKFGQVKSDRVYEHADFGNLKLFFANRAFGFLGVMRGEFRSFADFKRNLGSNMKVKRYLLTATDAEIYGYHRPGQEDLLADIYRHKFPTATISELIRKFPRVEVVRPRNSSWSTLSSDLKKGIEYPFWDVPESPVHRRLKELMTFTLRVVREAYMRNPRGNRRARRLLDRALKSDTFWWGSCYRSWWSPGLIEAGAYRYLQAVRAVKNIGTESLIRAESLYKRVVLTVLEWQFSGGVERTVRAALIRMGKFKARLKRVSGWLD